ncbi:uncharacterized protein SPAPADRAFT_47888 [Spathaspora passalidarum NRRL Y-27907]|uniref:Uncharacterized protein n=1 Tax=Spathaspora passalidarum (strain NRRL Y-27907 / 11-Y1) TaxID=619300 RepID=G3AF05_SPAPN|nr:uncharacterized protein SPAPADRAFT_47888 [Spathaspora passalidarum NRRL Y-27907]EGW34809.1 hypothetical protein SPAPADRAFT_47888 [Spathaspora passalidarum NRRL Y-27907]
MNGEQPSRESQPATLQSGYTSPSQPDTEPIPTSTPLHSPTIELSEPVGGTDNHLHVFQGAPDSVSPAFDPIEPANNNNDDDDNSNNNHHYKQPTSPDSDGILLSPPGMNKSYSYGGTITPPSGFGNANLSPPSDKLYKKQPRRESLAKKKDMLNNASGTNLNMFLRGDRRQSWTGAKPELMDSPKINSKLMMTSASNNTSLGTSSSMKSTISSGKLNGISDKNRLVDQFYRPNVKLHNRAHSSVDLASIFKSSIELTPGKRRWMNDSEMMESTSGSTLNHESALTDESFNEILNQGGFKFEFDREMLVQDDELINFVLNIDTILDEYPQDTNRPYEQLERIMTSMTDKLEIKFKNILLRHQPTKNKSLEELDSVEKYLHGLKLQTAELITQLNNNRELIRSKYREEINVNINKLTHVTAQLKGLEKRSNAFKEKITEENMVMSQDMIEKLELLENINLRMREYSRIRKARRFRRVQMLLSIGVVIFLAIYYGHR